MPKTTVDTLSSKSGDQAADVGARLKALRRLYGLSQRELAKRAGLTNGTISLIEQNGISPSIASLKKILSGFPMSLADFFSREVDQEAQVFFRAEELVEIGSGAVRFRQVGRNLANKKLQMLHETYAPGADTGESMLSHEGEESGVVVRGMIEITVGGQRRVLEAGDAYYFDSRLPHRFVNPGNEECEIVSVCTPPTF